MTLLRVLSISTFHIAVFHSFILTGGFQEKSEVGAPVLNLPSSHCAQKNEIEGLLMSYQTLLLHTVKQESMKLKIIIANCYLLSKIRFARHYY